MKRKLLYSIYLFGNLILLLNVSCKKLDTKVYDQVTDFWATQDQIAAGVAPVYTWLRDYAPSFNGTYELNEMSTDEIIVPGRGTDWNDNVVWEQAWKHTWTPEHDFVVGGWNFIYGGIARVNTILQSVNDLDLKPAELDKIRAELKAMRAFYNYIALDLFGNVPVAESNNTDLSKLATRKRADVFAYVEKELKENLIHLTSEISPRTYGRTTHWFAQALLAKLYINAKIFTGHERWTDCIAACDAILQSNKYSLEEDFFSNFKISNEASRENIFVIPFDRDAGLDYFMIQGFTLHYSSNYTFGLENGGFNGFCSTAEYLRQFDEKDIRRKMFLVGQQYINQIKDSAHMQYDLQGNPLVFDPDIKKFHLQPPNVEGAGARCAKWEFNKKGWGNMSNDFAIVRLADIILMKAEAQYLLGDVAGALQTINQKINGVSIRGRAGLADFTINEMNPDGLLRERACELAWEGWRRNDMIRFGHFTDARIPEKNKSEEFRTLYPIPQTELHKNPYLVQNPGY